MPLHLDGRDDRLLRWITAPVRQFSGGPLARITAAERTLVRALQPGTWWIAASVEHVPDALTPDRPADLRLATVQATIAGRELPAVRGGYTFALDGPLEVVLTLAPRR